MITRFDCTGCYLKKRALPSPCAQRAQRAAAHARRRGAAGCTAAPLIIRSMSLTPSEAYAAAALFALALRETLHEARADDGSAAALHDNSGSGESSSAQGVWLAGGLAQRAFADLGVPSRAWSVRKQPRNACAGWLTRCSWFGVLLTLLFVRRRRLSSCARRTRRTTCPRCVPR